MVSELFLFSISQNDCECERQVVVIMYIIIIIIIVIIILASRRMRRPSGQVWINFIENISHSKYYSPRRLNFNRSSCKIPAFPNFFNSYTIPKELFSVLLLSTRLASWSWYTSIYWALFVYISSPISLPVYTEDYILLFIVCPLTWKYINITNTKHSRYESFNFKLSW